MIDPDPPNKPSKRRRSRGFKRELGSKIPHKFCYSCGLNQYNRLTVDHIVPRAQGGAKRDPENLCFLCRDCNSHKGDLAPLDWLQRLCEGSFSTAMKPELLELLTNVVKAAVSHHERSKN